MTIGLLYGSCAAVRSISTEQSTERSLPPRKAACPPRGTAMPRRRRFSLRCGTNFVALVLPVGLVADRLWPFATTLWTPVLVALLTLGLTMELWRVVQGSSRRRHAFCAPGLALQRATTREPTLEETRLALTAVASVLRRELP